MTSGRGLVTGLAILVIATLALAGVLGGGPDPNAAPKIPRGETPGLTESPDDTGSTTTRSTTTRSTTTRSTGSGDSATAGSQPRPGATGPTSSVDSEQSETRPANPFAPPAPQTTVAQTRPIIPPAEAIDSICGSTSFLKSLVAIFVLPDYSAQNDAPAIRAAIDAYVAVTPPELSAAMDIVAATARETLNIAESGGWRPDDPAVRAQYESLARGDSQHAAFFASFSRVEGFESENCNGVTP